MKVKWLHFLAVGLLAASSASGIVIQTSFVGNPGNANDTTGFGGVSYSYHIGTTPVTNAQYTSFLNSVATFGDPHGLWNSNMGSSVHGGISRSGSGTAFDPFLYTVRTASSGFNNDRSMGEMPVNFVSFWDAARFANWLTTGNTETGVYVLTANGISNNTITRDATAWANGGVAIASENEWYKAAYFSGANTGSSATDTPNTSGYWLYPTQSNNVPTGTVPNSTNANSANRSGSLSPESNTVTPVGGYTLAASYYGTFDQGGNVWEWNDEIVFGSVRGLRGGSFNDIVSDMESSRRGSINAALELNNVGFRVSSLAVIPEPSTYAAILGSLGLGLALMRRKRRGNP